MTKTVLVMNKHSCHAANCNKIISPKLLMCLKHWNAVPKDLQKEVWKYYRHGQEGDKKPSLEYLVAQQAVVEAVARKEGFEKEAEEARVNKDMFMTMIREKSAS